MRIPNAGAKKSSEFPALFASGADFQADGAKKIFQRLAGPRPEKSPRENSAGALGELGKVFLPTDRTGDVSFQDQMMGLSRNGTQPPGPVSGPGAISPTSTSRAGTSGGRSMILQQQTSSSCACTGRSSARRTRPAGGRSWRRRMMRGGRKVLRILTLPQTQKNPPGGSPPCHCRDRRLKRTRGCWLPSRGSI